MGKAKAVIMGIILMGFGLVGCGNAKDAQRPELIRANAPAYDEELIQIGMIQTGKESDWRDANSNDYLNTFVKERGYELIYIDGNSSSQRQVKAMYDLIQQDVDYIILQPIIESGWEDAIRAARLADIPVIVADRQIDVDESEYISWIGSDFEAEGRKAVLWLEEYLEAQGRGGEAINIVLMEGTRGATATIGRTKGLLDGISLHKNWRIIERGCCNFTQGEGQTYIEGLLENGQMSDVDVVIAENDNMMFGAMEALKRNHMSFGPDGDIITISFDALHEAFERMVAGELHLSVECNPLLAGTIEKVILEMEAGKNVDKKYYTDEGVFSYENAAEFIDKRKY